LLMGKKRDCQGGKPPVRKSSLGGKYKKKEKMSKRPFLNSSFRGRGDDRKTDKGGGLTGESQGVPAW